MGTDLLRCRTGYEVVIPAGYRGLNYPGEIMFVDSQDINDVYYMFHVFLDNPEIQIYVCYSSGEKKRIVLEDAD